MKIHETNQISLTVYKIGGTAATTGAIMTQDRIVAPLEKILAAALLADNPVVMEDTAATTCATLDEVIDQLFEAREEAYLCYNLNRSEKLTAEIDEFEKHVMRLVIADEPTKNSEMSVYNGLRFLKMKLGQLEGENEDCITVVNKLMHIERMKRRGLKKIAQKRKREVPDGPPFSRPPGAPKKDKVWCSQTGDWIAETMLHAGN